MAPVTIARPNFIHPIADRYRGGGRRFVNGDPVPRAGAVITFVGLNGHL